MKRSVKALIIDIAIPLAVGALAGLLIMGSMERYQLLNQPPLAPPPWIFPVVWTVLYVLMGISSWRVSRSSQPGRALALRFYWVQLAVNFFWPLIYFRAGAYLAALLWLLLLLALVIAMILAFARVERRAALLQIPYLLWLIFATYLNLMIYLLN